MAEKVYIKVPVGRDAYDFVEVDVNRLGPQVLAELYHLSKIGGGKGRYMRAHGFDAIVGKLDVSELLGVHADMMGQCRQALEVMGPIGAILAERVLPLLAIDKVVHALSENKPADATELVRQGGYELMSVLSEIAGQMVPKAAVSDAWEATTSIVGGHAKAISQIYEKWSDAVKRLVDVRMKLEAAERSLEALRINASGISATCHGLLDKDAENIRQAMEFFEGPDGASIDEGFNARACSYTMLEALTIEQHADVKKARLYQDDLVGIEARAVRVWTEVAERIHEKGMSQKPSVDGLLMELDRATQDLHKAEEAQQGQAKMAPPHQAPEEWRFITEAQYQKALETLKDPAWSTATVMRRFKAMFEGLIRMANDTPTFSAEMQRMLREVAKSRVSLEEKPTLQDQPSIQSSDGAGDGLALLPPAPEHGTDPQSESPPGELHGPEEAPVTVPSATVEPMLVPAPPITAVRTKSSAERLEEVYEAAFAVAWALTGDGPNLNSRKKTVGFLHVAQTLGLIGIMDVEQFKADIEDRFIQESVEVSRGRVKRVWSREAKPLIRFWEKPTTGMQRRHKVLMFKCTASASIRAKALLEKFGLDEQKVRTANQANRERLRDQVQQRIEKRIA